MYTVIQGSLAKENGNWVMDGMIEVIEHEFDNIGDAVDFYTDCNPCRQFVTEWDCSSVKPTDKGFYVELVNSDIDSQIGYKDYTFDDYINALSKQVNV